MVQAPVRQSGGRVTRTTPAQGTDGETVIDESLSWLALTIQCDNPTGQWWYIPQADVFIPPYTVGTVRPLLGGSQRGSVVRRTPGGFTSNPNASETASFTFIQDREQALSGYSVSGFTAPFSTVLQGPLTSRSGTIAVAATSQQLMAENLARRYVLVVNPGTNTIWIRPGVAAATQAQPSIPILANGSYVMEGSMICTQAWQIIGPAAGDPFTAYEG